MSQKIGTVTLLKDRFYDLDQGSFLVPTGTYPIYKDENDTISFLLSGYPSIGHGTVEPIEPGLFSINLGDSIAKTSPVEFSPRQWTEEEFQEMCKSDLVQPGENQRLVISLLD